MIEIEEKLRNENYGLRSRLKGVNEQQTARIKKLTKVIRQLTKQHREKERQFRTLRDSLNALGGEKDKELSRLREEMIKSTQDRENVEAMCKSLTEQVDQIRKQVKAVTK